MRGVRTNDPRKSKPGADTDGTRSQSRTVAPFATRIYQALQKIRARPWKFAWLAAPAVSFQAFPHLTLLASKVMIAHPASEEAIIHSVGLFVYMPILCILFAILIGTTIDRLWQRLREVEQLLVQEATTFAELVPALLNALPSTDRDEVVRLAEDFRIYLKRLLNGREDSLQPLDEERRSEAESADPLVRLWLLREAVNDRRDVAHAAGNDVHFTRAESLLAKLAELRSRRVVVQLQGVPRRVLVTLYGLGVAMLFAFFQVGMGLQQGKVVPIRSMRLQIMFASLFSVLAVLHNLVSDLASPFSRTGDFSVSAANRIGRRVLVRPGRMLRKVQACTG